MSSDELIVDQVDIIKSIDMQIQEGEKLAVRLAAITPTTKSQLIAWRNTTLKILTRSFSGNVIASDFSLQTHGLTDTNIFKSTEAFCNELLQSIKILEGLKADLISGLHSPLRSSDLIDQGIAVTIITRLLKNFHKHIEEMYQAEVHRNGTLNQKILNEVKIGNEYDVQRMLYSIIKPIFPDARVEVPQDTGHKSVRFDIFLDDYNIVIEVKCTRPNMSERKLTEEVAADAFHYKADYLFFFVYDKEKKITNVESFEKAYSRNKEKFDKEVKAVVIRPITL